MNPSRRNNRKSRKQNARNRNGQLKGPSRTRYRNQNRIVHLSQRGRFAPDRTFVNLVYNDTTLVRNVSSSGSMNWCYRSSAYDPDPSVLSGAIPGFAELSNLYMLYRVHSMTVNITIGNQEQQNILVSIWPSNIGQNVNSLNSSDIMEYGANLRGKTLIIGPVSGNSTRSTTTTALASSLIGPNFKTDLQFASSVSTNPVEMFFINVGAINPIQNFGYDLVTKVSIVYNIELFRLRQLES